MGGALVTGAGRGLGLEISRRLAARGLTVHLTDVDGEAVEGAAAELGGSAFASRLDVRDPDACREAAGATAERAGSLDVWVNNAGILATGLTWEQDPELRRAVMDVNAHGTFNGTVAALELMRPAGRGHIINVISMAGLVAAPGEALYGASKHAAIAFTIGTLADLRRSGERGIRLSAVCPDGIWSPMLEDKLDDLDAAPSFSGQLLSPGRVAERTVALLDRPRVVLTIPRWRGGALRLIDAFPSLVERMVPALMADARRRQARWKRRIEAGEAPR
jgi:NAD(P)-dependent dehydrogenase (short-subunit alcohol dehydrogenase family)